MFRSRSVLVSLALLSWLALPHEAAAQPITQLKTLGTAGDITANGGAVTMTGTGGMTSLLIQTVGTFSLTWEAQCAGDGTTFDTDDEIPVTLIASSPTAADSVATNVEGLYTATIAGCRSVRVIATAYTSGTMTVTLTATPTGGGSSSGGGGGGAVTNAGTFAVQVTQGGNTAAVNASSQLSVTCANCSGSGVSVNEDVASADGQAGTPAYSVRNDTLTGATSTDGDYQPIKSNASGALYNQPTYAGVIASTGTGASGAQTPRVVTATDSTIGTVTTVSTVTAVTNVATIGTSVTPGTAAANLGKAEDAVAASGDTGVGLLAVREDVPTSTASGSGDYIHIKADALGKLFTAHSFAEDAAHVSGDSGAFVMGIRRDTTPASSSGTAGDYSAFNLDANGRLYVQAMLANSAGTELTPSVDVVEDAPETAGGSGPMVMNVRRDVLASSAGTTGDNTTFNSTSNGALWVAEPDPCSFGSKVFVNITQTTGTQLFAGTASNRTYVCAIHLVSATAQNIALVSGTGTVCATGIGGMAGGTTAGTGWNLAANGGLVIAGGNSSIAKSAATADNVCLLQSGAGQISGNIVYVVSP